MKRAVATIVVLFFVIVFFPIPAFADTEPCGLSTLSASGYFFDSYENIQYSDGGYLIHSFHNLPQYSDGRSFSIRWSYLDDECNSLTSTSSFVSISLPAGVTDWSIRFNSREHFDVWDDQNEVVIAGFDIPAVPLYTRVAFEGTVDNGGSVFTSQTLHIQKDAEPPSFQNKIDKPTPCSAGGANGYYFDSSESAEYVDGLLRVHLRLKTPYNDGRVFRTSVLVADDLCVTNVPDYSSLSPDTIFTPHIRYFSFRMTSSTHFVLWDDENDVALSCVGCAGDIPDDSTYVSFYGTIDGDASIIQTTPLSPTEFQKCCSSVLFLPGIKGSRLYVETDGSENKLWEPDLFEGNDDVRGMSLDSNGKSIGNVYVKEGSILDSAGGKDYYKSFTADMDALESSGDIEDWRSVAYDWRLSLDDILANGAEIDGKIFYGTATSTPYITQTLRALASESQTGKVTIVAHSNGGLVTKALLQQLGDTEAQKLVDRVIFVGVPQSGAPQSIGSLLYGYKEGIPDFFPFVVKASTAREFAENSPMGYHLLPSQQYFDDTKDSNHPVVIFDGERAFEKERTAYGPVINNSTELGDFLLARDGGREKPLSGHIGKANVLNATLIDYGHSLHDSLDVWVPPQNITVYQIAGWGIDTVAGIEFYDAPQVSALTALNPKAYRPIFVEDGDYIVPISSALMMSTSTENVKRYWVNLKQYRKDARKKNDHGDILEISELRQFVKNLLDETNALTNYVQTEQPAPAEQAKKLRFFLHSPLTLELYDSSGNHVGQNEDGSFDAEIPDVEYGEFGDVQYIIAPQGPEYRLVLNGLDVGTFSLDIQEVEGGSVTRQTTLANIPTTENTLVTLNIGDGIESTSLLEVDEGGDGVIDITLQPLVGETIMYEESVEPEEVTIETPVNTGGGGPIWNTPVGIVAGTSTVAIFSEPTSTPIRATTTPVETFQVLPIKNIETPTKESEKKSIQKTQAITQTAPAFSALSQQRDFFHLIRGVYNDLWKSFKLLNFLF